VVAWLLAYWYIPALVVIIAGIFGAKKLANKNARNAALYAIWKLEDRVFETMDERIEAIAELGYELLPVRIRLIVSEKAFTSIVTQVYDELKALIDKIDGVKHKIK
jgi:hypothetical protein